MKENRGTIVLTNQETERILKQLDSMQRSLQDKNAEIIGLRNMVEELITYLDDDLVSNVLSNLCERESISPSTLGF